MTNPPDNQSNQSNPPKQTEPRYPGVSRRAFFRNTAGLGFAALAVPVLAACGGSTASPGSNPPDTAAGSTSAATPGSTEAAEATTTAAVDGAPTDTAAVTEEAPTAVGSAFADGRQLQIDFTYEANGGGRIHSPYIAVWIESPDGDLVQTVSLWYKSDERKYLKDLKRWNSKNNSDALTTGATRIPGSFSVAWNGTDLAGNQVADGEYFVCLEAAREDGPYQIIREAAMISGALAPTALTPNGELTAAAVALVA